jgi:hypothetical protein
MTKLKLIDLLKEINLVKDKWEPIPSSELKQYSEEIFNLISTAYAPIGGHPNYKSPNDILGRESDAEYEVIDLDDDKDIDAVSVTKQKTGGSKFVATGHDNSSIAKSKVINHKAELLKQPGYYIEVSGKIGDILKAKGVETITDKNIVFKVMGDKKIEWLGDGNYRRTIGGESHIKTLMGRPKL